MLRRGTRASSSWQLSWGQRGDLLSGDLGKFSQVVGDADIAASMEHLSAAIGGAAGAPSLSRASPVPQFLCLQG